MQPDSFDVSQIMLQLFDQAVESIAVVTHEGRMLYANEITALYSGKSMQEMRGELLWDVFPDVAGTLYEREFRRAAREQTPVTMENYFPPTDKWFEVRFNPSPDAVAIYSADITERKRVAEAARLSEAKYHLLIDALDQGYALCEMIWDTAGRAVDFRFLEGNRAFLADSNQNTIGRAAKEVAPGLEDAWTQHYAEVLRTGCPIRFEQSSAHLGKVFDVFAFPVDANRFIMLFTDITERRRQERELEALNERLRRAMQETHHRIKNNLQVVAALVEIQVCELNCDAAVAPLRRINQHVQTLAVIHDLLTRNAADHAALSHLSARAVLSALVPLLQNTIGSRRIISRIATFRLQRRRRHPSRCSSASASAMPSSMDAAGSKLPCATRETWRGWKSAMRGMAFRPASIRAGLPIPACSSLKARDVGICAATCSTTIMTQGAGASPSYFPSKLR